MPYIKISEKKMYKIFICRYCLEIFRTYFITYIFNNNFMIYIYIINYYKSTQNRGGAIVNFTPLKPTLSLSPNYEHKYNNIVVVEPIVQCDTIIL